MSSLDQYNQAFIDALALRSEDLNASLVYQSVPNWDSVGHMQLMTALEDSFDIMLDTDDIIDFSSYEIGKEILRKYDVDFC
ncbi:MAG: hypothetical protein FWE65_03555 [Eggerthellaceae bacterium]|nr:hypothetical protein [Eggerthellaceae bacterium]